MGRVRRWAKAAVALLDSPRFMLAFHGWGVIFWLVMAVASWALGWLSAVTYVSLLSIYALALGHWSSWQSVRVERKQDQARREQAGADSGDNDALPGSRFP